MAYSLRFSIVILAIRWVEGVSQDDCWVPCNNFQHGSCVSIQCKTDSRATYECHLISTVMPSYLVKKPHQTCITPHEVPGMAHFCSDLLNNGSLLLENLHRDIKPETIKPVIENEDGTVATRSDCIPLTILAGVAVGCFTAGCTVTWLFLLVLWSRNTTRCCEENSKESNSAENDRQQSTNPMIRNEVVPARMMSVSHRRLLSSSSIDSGMSSSQVVVPVSPPPATSTMPAPHIHDTTQTSDTGDANDYTRLNREPVVSIINQEHLQVTSDSDYAGLVTSDVLNMNNYAQVPYQKLQSANNSKTEQSERTTRNDKESVLPTSDSVVNCSSVSRSIRSDIHDYESIFSDAATNAEDMDYADCGNRGGSESDYHEYHVCDASNSLERHEYFVLQESPHEYFMLEKDS